jgi:hypothetical protein
MWGRSAFGKATAESPKRARRRSILSGFAGLKPSATLCVLAGLVVVTPLTAAAQSPSTPPPSPSTLQVQEVETGWMAAPDVKFGEIDNRTATLVGGYAGWVTDRTFLVGGGAYWLANGHDGTEMAYGGLVLEWLARTDRRIGFGARGLIGGGEATLPVSYNYWYGPGAPVTSPHDVRFGARHGGKHGPPPPPTLADRRVLWSDAFFIAEPQANLLVNLTDWCRINAGVGYRLVGASNDFDDRLTGVSGTIAVQFGGGTK